MTWGLNFAYDNATNAVDMALSIFRAFSPASETSKNGVVLDLIELGMSSELFASADLTHWLYVTGNEPDLYHGKARPSNWTMSQFVQKLVPLYHLSWNPDLATHHV